MLVTLTLSTHFREFKVRYFTKIENVQHVCIRRNECAVHWWLYGETALVMK